MRVWFPVPIQRPRSLSTRCVPQRTQAKCSEIFGKPAPLTARRRRPGGRCPRSLRRATKESHVRVACVLCSVRRGLRVSRAPGRPSTASQIRLPSVSTVLQKLDCTGQTEARLLVGHFHTVVCPVRDWKLNEEYLFFPRQLIKEASLRVDEDIPIGFAKSDSGAFIGAATKKLFGRYSSPYRVCRRVE